MSVASDFERVIRRYQLAGLEEALQGETFILPHYGGYSIANLPATLATLLGTELAGAAPPIPQQAWGDFAGDVRTIVLVILDAVGYVHLQRMLAEEESAFGRLARVGRLLPLTSVFPSTTMTALTTLWTGRTPGHHGFLGTSLFLSELGVLANMIRLAPAVRGRPGSLLDMGWSPERFITVPYLAQVLADAGVQRVAHLHGPYVGSGLARLFLQGMAQVRGFVAHGDLWINVRDTLLQRTEESLFVSVYWSGTDDVAHAYGPDSERFRVALRQLARSLEEDLLAALPASAREGTLLIITADHGQTTTPPARAVHLGDHPALKQMLLLPPAGESRAAYLYVRPGMFEAVRSYVAGQLADRFLLLETDQALAAGLYGDCEILPQIRARLGDLILLARGDSRLIPEGEQASSPGQHGSLTPEEMLVPLLLARLDS